MPRRPIPVLPFLKTGIPTTEFQNFILEVENLFLVESNQYQAESKVSFKFLQTYHQLWVLHWFVKETWYSTHKIPSTNRKLKYGYKKFGVLYKSAKAIIEDLCVREFGYSSEYSHQPAKWLIEVMKESRIEGQTRLHAEKFKTKTSELIALDKERAGLRKYENLIERDLFPHTWRFYESALASAENNYLDVFLSEKWKPFQQNLNAVNKEIRKPHWLHFTSDGNQKIYFSPTKELKYPIEAEKYVEKHIKFSQVPS